MTPTCITCITCRSSARTPLAAYASGWLKGGPTPAGGFAHAPRGFCTRRGAASQRVCGWKVGVLPVYAVWKAVLEPLYAVRKRFENRDTAT